MQELPHLTRPLGWYAWDLRHAHVEKEHSCCNHLWETWVMLRGQLTALMVLPPWTRGHCKRDSVCVR